MIRTVIVDGILCDPFSVKKQGENAAIASSLKLEHSIVPHSIIILKRSVDARKKMSVFLQNEINIRVLFSTIKKYR